VSFGAKGGYAIVAAVSDLLWHAMKQGVAWVEIYFTGKPPALSEEGATEWNSSSSYTFS